MYATCLITCHAVDISGKVYVNRSRVVYADATVTNGVIHAIDRVLWPRGLDDLCEDSFDEYDDTSDDTDASSQPIFTMH